MNDHALMAHALTLGRRGLGRVWPNPAVGAVIVNDGRVVGRGWTAPGGRPHAETQALAQAGDGARGGTAYVTLEPCSHQGQTGPCAQALIDAGLRRVVTALTDPDPRVSGRGHAMMQASGIEVIQDVGADQARYDQAGFLQRVTQGRPMVTLKLATSFDGRIATASGDSQWITGPLARRAVHAMRASHDAVLVGGGTARADDPMLTVRDLGVAHQPVRVVLSRKLDMPLDNALMRSAGEVPLWLCHGDDLDPDHVAAFTRAGAVCIPCRTVGRQLDLAAVFQQLGARGLTRVFCEGGGALAASLLLADLVDRLVGMTAGLPIGAEGVPVLGALGFGGLDEAPRYALHHVRRIGGDVCHEWARI